MNPLIPALDSEDLDQIREWAELLAPESGLLKLGLQAYCAHGPALLSEIAGLAPVFADIKLHDIPNTVAGAAAALARRQVRMVTVHASGGPRMVAAAVSAAPEVDVLAVTVLTSLGQADLAEVGQPAAAEQVPRLARMAVEAGAAGVVCAAAETASVRAAVGPDALVVVPGIRPAGVDGDDQSRTATPEEAIGRGASHIVVGRPITQSEDPLAAARSIRARLGPPGTVRPA